MDMKNLQIGEKVFYTLTIEFDYHEDITCNVELLTGDFNDDAIDDIDNSLADIEYNGKHTGQEIWQHIKRDWDNPDNLDFDDGLYIQIEREETESEFSYDGCDLCDNRLGNNVYSCIGYNDASEVKKGEFYELDVCADCLCEYHGGVSL